MATMRQYSGLVGRRVKPNYVEAINAQTPSLMSLYSAKDAEKYQNKMLGLEEQRLAQEKELSDASLALSEESMKEQEKQNKKANLYSGLGLGTNLGLGYMQYKAGDPASIYGATSETGNLAGTASSLSKDATTNLADYGEGLREIGKTSASDFFSTAGAGNMSNWTKALTSPKTYLTGLGTGIAGGQIGKSLLGDNDLTGALSGAAVGGLTEYLTGGNIYSSLTSGLLGGIGGLLF